MTTRLTRVAVTALVLACAARAQYAGFDRNVYPGDAALPALRHVFRFAGYWLNAPPGRPDNSWTGKRTALLQNGFGFLVLFNGRLEKELTNPAALGSSDAASAAGLARKEGFPPRTVIFLDQEEGGRLDPSQRAYVHAWIDAVNARGFRAGVYCSAVPFREGDGSIVNTADDLRHHAGRRAFDLFVYNDACPPSPGCVFVAPPRPVDASAIWQYAQSPRRKELTASCAATYASSGACLEPTTQLDVDVSSATSPDPSHGR